MLQRVFTLLNCGFVASLAMQVPEMPESLILYKPYRNLVDNSTWANIQDIIVTHYHMDLLVNFTTNELQGSVIHDFTVTGAQVQYIQLDIWDVFIERIEMVPPGSAMNATTHQGNVPFYDGNPIAFKIQFPLTDDWCLVIDLGQNYTLGTELSL